MILAQVSDPHVALEEDGSDNAGARGLAEAVQRITAMAPAPECVLLTGDLTDHGRPEEYARLRALLAPLAVAVHPLVGNHDDRDALRSAFSDHPQVAATTGFVQYAVDAAGLRVIACDTQSPGEDRGVLCAQRLAWLARELDRAGDLPVLLALHHPPFATGIDGMDAIGLTGAGELGVLLEAYAGPCAVVCGHAHRTIVATAGGRSAFLAPSTSLAIALDLRAGVPFRLVHEPPGFALHLHRGGGELVSHMQPLGDFGASFEQS